MKQAIYKMVFRGENPPEQNELAKYINNLLKEGMFSIKKSSEKEIAK